MSEGRLFLPAQENAILIENNDGRNVASVVDDVERKKNDVAGRWGILLASKRDEERRRKLCLGGGDCKLPAPGHRRRPLGEPQFDFSQFDRGQGATINKKSIVQGAGPIEYKTAAEVEV